MQVQTHMCWMTNSQNNILYIHTKEHIFFNGHKLSPCSSVVPTQMWFQIQLWFEYIFSDSLIANKTVQSFNSPQH